MCMFCRHFSLHTHAKLNRADHREKKKNFKTPFHSKNLSYFNPFFPLLHLKLYKMKQLLPKPISSPSRADKFPPPLLRFLKNNGGSKSRGRYRSSPIFIRKKSETANETLEPSSPKVTCMGQVRGFKRSKTRPKSTSRSRNGMKKSRSLCWWIRKALFWNRLNKKSDQPRASSHFWRRWVVCFQMGFSRKVEIMKETPKKTEEEGGGHQETEQKEQEDKEVFVIATPPKNALLLMRCRSEPYRASSLANQFWGSPSPSATTEQENRGEKEENPTSETGPICRDSAREPRKSSEIEEKLGFCKGLENSTTSSNSSSSKTTTTTEEEALKTRPMILTRCKSEPAGRSEKFDLETCFWNTKVGFR